MSAYSNVSRSTGLAPPSETATARSLWDGIPGRTRLPPSSLVGGHTRLPPGTTFADPRHAPTAQNMERRRTDLQGERDRTERGESSRYTASTSKRSSTHGQSPRAPSRTSMASSPSTIRPPRRSVSQGSHHSAKSPPQSPLDYMELGFTGSKNDEGIEKWKRRYIRTDEEGRRIAGTETVEIDRHGKGT